MSVRERTLAIRLREKIEKRSEYAEQIGVRAVDRKVVKSSSSDYTLCSKCSKEVGGKINEI